MLKSCISSTTNNNKNLDNFSSDSDVEKYWRRENLTLEQGDSDWEVERGPYWVDASGKGPGAKVGGYGSRVKSRKRSRDGDMPSEWKRRRSQSPGRPRVRYRSRSRSLSPNLWRARRPSPRRRRSRSPWGDHYRRRSRSRSLEAHRRRRSRSRSVNARRRSRSRSPANHSSKWRRRGRSPHRSPPVTVDLTKDAEVLRSTSRGRSLPKSYSRRNVCNDDIAKARSSTKKMAVTVAVGNDGHPPPPKLNPANVKMSLSPLSDTSITDSTCLREENPLGDRSRECINLFKESNRTFETIRVTLKNVPTTESNEVSSKVRAIREASPFLMNLEKRLSYVEACTSIRNLAFDPGSGVDVSGPSLPPLPTLPPVQISVFSDEPKRGPMPSVGEDDRPLVPGPNGLPVHVTPDGRQIPYDMDGRKIPVGPNGHYLPLDPYGKLFAHIISPENSAVPIHITEDGVLRLPDSQPVPFGPPHRLPVNVDGSLILIGPDSKPLFPCDNLPKDPSAHLVQRVDDESVSSLFGQLLDLIPDDPEGADADGVAINHENAKRTLAEMETFPDLFADSDDESQSKDKDPIVRRVKRALRRSLSSSFGCLVVPRTPCEPSDSGRLHESPLTRNRTRLSVLGPGTGHLTQDLPPRPFLVVTKREKDDSDDIAFRFMSVEGEYGWDSVNQRHCASQCDLTSQTMVGLNLTVTELRNEVIRLTQLNAELLSLCREAQVALEKKHQELKEAGDVITEKKSEIDSLIRTIKMIK